MRDLCRYSSDLNVIHFIMDHFQTDIFLEIIEENSLGKKMEGFTLFRENLACSDTTSIGFPPVFTADIYNGSSTISDFFTGNIAANGFQNVLFDEGFKLNIIPNIHIPVNNAANYFMIPHDYIVSSENIFSAKIISHGLKQKMRFNSQKTNLSNGNENSLKEGSSGPKSSDLQIRSVFRFMNDYINNIKSGDTRPVYHLIFIFPPHPPYVINKNGEFSQRILKPTRDNFKTQSKYTLNLFFDLIQKLREEGLYDNSLIILQSDHGGQEPPVINGEVCDVEMHKTPAMLAVKPPFSRTPMIISDAQTMNSDIPATIMDVLNISYPFKGDSIFKIDPAENRQRFFVTGKKEKYLVEGSLYSKSSWTKVENIRPARDVCGYSFGSVVQFGLAGNAENYQGYGWSVPSDEYTWNDGNRCSMAFLLEDINSGLLLNASFFSYLPKKIIDKQRVNIFANNQMTGQWVIGKKGVQAHSLIIPKDHLTGIKMLLEFEFPDARSPKSLNLSPDERVLALAFFKITLERYDPASKQNDTKKDVTNSGS